jgi:hypothetical protein
MLTAGEIASTEYADATLEEVGLSEKIVARYDKPGVPNLIDETVRKYIDRNPLRHIRPPARSITLSNTQVPHRAPAVSENRACAILIVY